MTQGGIRNTEYKPPFQWFGGKSAVADIVWDALGDVTNYVEPFFGSGAVLMLRPGGAGNIETVNDADGFVANFWRASGADPDAVAFYADNPVNECDLHAWHMWLLAKRGELTDKLCGDPEFFDARIAGKWAWGQCCWIGGGWCAGVGPWHSVDGVMTKLDDGGVWRQLPHLGDAGRGVNRQRPHLGDAGQGVNRQRPHLGDAGRGVNRQLPHLGPGQGVNRKLPHLGDGDIGECEARLEYLKEYFGKLRDRLRNMRVCCGDWSRVCGPTVTHRHGLTGVFLDPPYADTAGRDPGCYAVDCLNVAHDVRDWAVEQGDNPKMRIVLAGYEGEHEMPESWRVIEWKTRGGYANQGNGETAGIANKSKERLWLSPHCLGGAIKATQRSMFAETA